MLKEYVSRMIKEQAELSIKLNKLGSFLLDYDKAGQLPEYKKILMKKQYDAMCEYSNILSERIEIEIDEEIKEIEKDMKEAQNNTCTYVDGDNGKYYDPRTGVWK